MNFKELVEREDAYLAAWRRTKQLPRLDLEVRGEGRDEPWVSRTNRDLFGLALSGGGIRSASFNLGVLQTLAGKGVLEHVDLLSTVSGGGYIGGFWSALRRRDLTPNVLRGTITAAQWRALATEARQQLLAPHRIWVGTSTGARPLISAAESEGALAPGSGVVLSRRSGQEPPEVRHVREFSQFLVPRVGLLKQETWAGLIAVIGGMVPTLLLTTAFIWILCVIGLFFAKAALGSQSLVVCLGLAGLGGFAALEALFHQHQPEESGTAKRLFVFATLTGLAGAAVAFWLDIIPKFELHLAVPQALLDPGLAVSSLLPSANEFEFQWPLLSLSKVWALCGLLALCARMIASRGAEARELRMWARIASYFFIGAGLWAVAVLAWEGARWGFLPGHSAPVGTAGLLSGGLFLWLRDWLTSKPGDSRGASFVSAALSWAKPAVPQAFAAIAAFVLICAMVAGFQALAGWRGSGPWPYGLLAGALVVILLVGALVDPNRVGLARFYAQRIARAFIGASRPHAPVRTVEQPDDQVLLRDLAEVPGPLHLVCCAANDMLGDELQTLQRGARSVTLSPLAISIGGHARAPGELSLAAALSASAAAFNSQMGSISMQFGLAVSFLMTAFNLRLGLWVPHPLAGEQKPWLQRFEHLINLFDEALGRTQCAPIPGASAPAGVPALHLSDGGHFENLGLYELVRRHCRFIIVSDATADPTFAFDDLGNAIRRVREDFQIEIELDIDKLRPTDGRSAQHAVLGTIHYDGVSGSDKGTLLYLKPSFVGGEPLDVQQYRTRQSTFPHEPTTDQFYDEAQWESYRRLGEHVASTTLSVKDWVDKSINPVEALFLDLQRKWHAAPDQQLTTFLAFTERCSNLESEIRRSAPVWFRLELFPELRIATREAAGDDVRHDLEELNRAVVWVMQMGQLMEDVWLSAGLDSYGSHPLNQGWMAYFHRWANMPSFRRWWPLVRSIYANDFCNFMKSQFKLLVSDEFIREGREKGRRGAIVDLARSPDEWNDEHAELMQLARFSQNQLRYVLRLESGGLAPIPVGSVVYVASGSVRAWKSEDMRVPPWLRGGGFEARFLERVRLELAAFRLEVSIPASEPETVSFYKSRDFVVEGTTDDRVRVVRAPRE